MRILIYGTTGSTRRLALRTVHAAGSYRGFASLPGCASFAIELPDVKPRSA